MGNKSSTASFPTDATVATVVKTINTFTPIFVKAYGVCVVKKLQQLHEEQESGGPDALLAEKEGYMLERPPLATEPMERSWAVKLGEVKKNWKRRFFVATEEADGFVVYYFEKEKDASSQSKAKGCIHPCGYLVRNTTAEEDVRDRQRGGKDVPDFGLVLEPLDKKRTWVLRFDSEEARSRWRHVLQFASLRCSPPLFNLKDPLLTEAFKDAYHRTRRLMGVSGYYALDRPEKEQLALLASQACEVGPLAPLYRSIALAAAAGAESGKAAGAAGAAASSGAIDAAEADRLRAAVDKELERIVTAVVDSAWPAVLARVELRRDAVEEIAEASLGVILREEDVKKAELRESLGPVIRPAVRELSRRYLDIVTGALLKPLYKAHREAIKVFWHRIHDIVERGLKEQELRALYKDSRWQYTSLGPAFKKIRALTRGEVDDSDSSGSGHGGSDGAVSLLSELVVPVGELVAMMSPVTLWEVEVAFEGSIRALVGWAIYSFVAAVERARGRVTPIECLHAVMRAMLYDSKQRQRGAITSVLKSVIVPNIRSSFNAIPQVQTALASSVAHGFVPPSAATSVLPFVAVPYGPTPAAATPAAASGAGAAGGQAALIPMPSATPVLKNKKALAAVHAEVKASSLGELYVDSEWLVEEMLEEAVGAAINSPAASGGIEDRVTAMLARLDKLPGKLGFSAM